MPNVALHRAMHPKPAANDEPLPWTVCFVIWCAWAFVCYWLAYLLVTL